MTIPMDCTCGTSLRIPKRLAGKRCRCSSCGKIITVPKANQDFEGGGEAAPEQRRAHSPRRRKKEIATKAPGAPREWKSVFTGLTVYYTSLLLLIFTIFAAPVLILVLGRAIPILGLAVTIICLLVIFGAAVAMIVGKVFCCGVPVKSGLRNYITGSIVLLALSMLSSVLVALAGRSEPLPVIVNSIPGLFGIGGEVMFLLFLRGLGQVVKSRNYPKSVERFIIFTAGLFVLSLVTPFLAQSIAASGSMGMFIMLFLGLVVVMILWLAWYVVIIRDARNLVRRVLGISTKSARRARKSNGGLRTRKHAPARR